MPSMNRDDNQTPLPDPSGYVPFWTSGTTLGVTTGATTAEVDATTALASGRSEPGKRVLLRLATGASDVYYAFGAAGGTFTSANMAYLPQRWVEYITVNSATAKSLYHLQVTAAGALQVTVLGVD